MTTTVSFPNVSLQEHYENIFGKKVTKSAEEDIKKLKNSFLETCEKVYHLKNITINDEKVLENAITRQLGIIKNLCDKIFLTNIQNDNYYSQVLNLIPLSEDKYQNFINCINYGILCINNLQKTLNCECPSIIDQITGVYLAKETTLLTNIKKVLEIKLKEIKKIEKFCKNFSISKEAMQILPSKYYSFFSKKRMSEKLEFAFTKFSREIQNENKTPRSENDSITLNILRNALDVWNSGSIQDSTSSDDELKNNIKFSFKLLKSSISKENNFDANKFLEFEDSEPEDDI